MAKPKISDTITAGHAIGVIGDLQREIDVITAQLNERVEELKKKAEEKIVPLRECVMDQFGALYTYAEGDRSTLTEGGVRKTIEFPAGKFGWRMSPPAVSIRNKEKVLEILKGLGLERFIRIVEEPDKEAMLKERDVAETVRGVKFVQEELFFVKPTDVAAEIHFDVKKLRGTRTTRKKK